MSFLKTLFWIVIAVVVALFCFSNWTVVAVNLWNGLILETKLPLLLAVFYLLGLIPPLILWQAARWRLRRHLMTSAAPPPLIVTTPEPTPAPAYPPVGA